MMHSQSASQQILGSAILSLKTAFVHMLNIAIICAPLQANSLMCILDQGAVSYCCFCADEEYLQSSDTGRGYGGPEMQALKTATSAVSKMVNEDVSIHHSAACCQASVFAGLLFKIRKHSMLDERAVTEEQCY